MSFKEWCIVLVLPFLIRETSTTRMNTNQFTTYLNLIEAFALREFGMVLPVPDDLKYALE